MKMTHWLKLVGINLLLVIVIILPFLPGPPSRLVIGLSALAQSAGFFGLLLVPIGIAWAILEIRKLGKRNAGMLTWKLTYYLAITATVICTVISLVLSIGVAANLKMPAPAVLVMVALAFGLNRAIREIRKPANNPNGKLNPIPFYLLTIPVIAFTARTQIMKPLSEYSRSFAIEKSQILIASIEHYKSREGHYPESMQDLEGRYIPKIPTPSIMGIENFRYNKISDRYSISFSQWLELGSLEEIVLYDRDNLRNNLEGRYAKYDYSFDLCRVKGAFASHQTSYDNWSYYLID